MALLLLPPPLTILRERGFLPRGLDIRLVGGCVRDLLLNKIPDDIDLATDATPAEQIEIYKDLGFAYYETGPKHGTLTVSLGDDDVVEITSLRTETDHDGRHATVSYTRDWEADLARRDLTFNAMAMELHGAVSGETPIIDPFGGRQDLLDKRVRFVGSADERMREDYLRILRWLRFHGRIAPGTPLDPDTCDAAIRNAQGLEKISRERVWSEVGKFLAGGDGPFLMREMMRLGLAYPCGLPHGSWREVSRVHAHTRDPVTLLVAFLGDPNRVRKLAERWKWSREESTMAAFLADHQADDQVDLKRLLAHERRERRWVHELALLQDRTDEARDLEQWVVPEFPLRGQDLLETGMKPGKHLGEILTSLRALWTDGGYRMTAAELLATLHGVEAHDGAVD